MIKADEIPNPSTSQLASLPRQMEFTPVVNPSPQVLSPSQIARYNAEGYLMPFDGLDDRESRELRAFFDGVLAAYMEMGRGSYAINTAHLRFARLYELVRHPRIVNTVADLLGPNVVCWDRTSFAKCHTMANEFLGIKTAPIGH